MRSLVTSILLYACESLTLTAELKRRIHAMEMRCYRKILHTSYKDHVRGSPCQDPAGNWTTRRPPDDLRSGQNHLARHSERGKKTRQTEEEVGRQHQGMDRPRVRQVPEDSGEQGQGKMEKTGGKTTLADKGLMMMMMMMMMMDMMTNISITSPALLPTSYPVSNLATQ